MRRFWLIAMAVSVVAGAELRSKVFVLPESESTGSASVVQKQSPAQTYLESQRETFRENLANTTDRQEVENAKTIMEGYAQTAREKKQWDLVKHYELMVIAAEKRLDQLPKK